MLLPRARLRGAGEFFKSPHRASEALQASRNPMRLPRARLRCAGEFFKSPHRASEAFQASRNPMRLPRARLRCAGEFFKSAANFGLTARRTAAATTPRCTVPGLVGPRLRTILSRLPPGPVDEAANRTL